MALAGLGLAGLGCSSVPALGPAASPQAPSPTPIERPAPQLVEGVQAGDRIAAFDRISFSQPVAIAYDDKRDVYWVSNMGEANGERGSKGFISRLDPEGRIATLNFIDGNREGIELDSPRGLTVAGDVLVIADGDALRRFNADTGDQLDDVVITGATHLSDVSVGPIGDLYATDVGSAPSLAALEDTGTDAVYRISASGESAVIAKRPNLGGPYAIVADNNGLWITCTGSGDLLLLIPNDNGQPSDDAGRLPLPGAEPQGLVGMRDGTFLLSSRTAGTVYRGPRDGPFLPFLEDLETPGDLGYDTRRNRVLVPLAAGHALGIFELGPPESVDRTSTKSSAGSSGNR